MRAVLIDLDGVLYQGDQIVPGAATSVSWLTEQAIPHLFVTNTTSRPRQNLVDKLEHLGIETTLDRILTPPVAARKWLATHAPGPAALFVPKATQQDLSDLPVLPETAQTGAVSVILGDLGEAWSFPLLNRAFRLLMAEPAPVLVALGMTRYWRAPDGLRLDVAPFVKALEHATGRQAVVLGKPSIAFFDAALDVLQCHAHDAVMIGDDIVGDVQGARRAGLQGVLVRTGKFREADLKGDIHPDAVLDAIGDFPSWWQQHVAQ